MVEVEQPARVVSITCIYADRIFISELLPDEPTGAEASARLYSLIETAKASGVEPYHQAGTIEVGQRCFRVGPGW